MAVTIEQIKEAAKKASMTLTEEQEKAYLAIDKLPEKKERESSTKDVKNGIPKERFDEINTRMKDAEKIRDELKEKLDGIDTDKAKKKGDYEKLTTDLKEKIKANDEKVKSTVKSFKAQLKLSAVKSAIETELIKEGCVEKYLEKAKKLFDESKVNFSFKSEEGFDYEVQKFEEYMKEFKVDNPFLFDGEVKDENEDNTSLFKPKTAPKTKDTSEEKEAERIRNLKAKFPALENVQ